MVKKVLVIDDDVGLLDVMTDLLSDPIYQVETIKDGLNALRRIKDRQKPHPDLVILDVNIPGFNGLEIAQTIKANQKTRHIPVIIISANASGRAISNILSTDCDEVVPKPFDKNDLMKKIENLLSESDH